MSHVSDKIFLAGHYARTGDATREGYEGTVYREFGYHEPLSGMDSQSFWLTYPSIVKAFRACHFGLVREQHYPDWRNGPWLNAYFVRSASGQ